MTCFWPLYGLRSKRVNEKTGKRSITFDKKLGFIDMPVTLPCGRCIGCKLDLSRQWALRCMHEAEESDDNCYITLTYAPEHLPEGGTLLKKDFQDFMKRLRKKYGNKIRYYHSGEYGGTNTLRPHYHALIFNLGFDDLVHFKTVNEIPLFTSEKLTKLWGKGHCSVGRVTIDSAAYVARYIMKKQYPNKKDPASQASYVENYERINTTTGEIHTVSPEYSTMSKNIGKEWFKRYKTSVYPKDFLTYRGEKFKPPKFYDRLYEADSPEKMAIIRHKRKKNMEKQSKNQTINRLRTRERIQSIRATYLPRTLSEQT